MEDFDFCAFMDQFTLTLDSAAMVFAISRRTVTRWRTSGRIPRTAAQLARSITLNSPPWNCGFRRGWSVGATRLPLAFRNQYFGDRWHARTTELDAPRYLAHRKRMAAAQGALAAATKRKARDVARKSAATRLARAEALSVRR